MKTNAQTFAKMLHVEMALFSEKTKEEQKIVTIQTCLTTTGASIAHWQSVAMESCSMMEETRPAMTETKKILINVQLTAKLLDVATDLCIQMSSEAMKHAMMLISIIRTIVEMTANSMCVETILERLQVRTSNSATTGT